MKVTQLLAAALGRKDEQPNIELAEQIVAQSDHVAIEELILTLADRKLQNDCIKVLYEIGARAPELIAPHLSTFADLLKHKNNRLIWGAMIAIDSLAHTIPQEVAENLLAIVDATDAGSVITKDHGVGILAKMSCMNSHSSTSWPLLLEQLRKCVPKQLPMYAEKSMVAVSAGNKAEFGAILQNRLPELEKASQVKRIEKVMRKLEKLQ